MRPSLADPREKLSRAREHLQLLDTEVAVFMKSNPYRCTYERDPKDGSHVWGVEVAKAAPMRLSILVGDATHNLRSCLDHIVWQLSLLTTATPYSRSEFPIYDVEFEPQSNECFDKRGRVKIQHVPYPAKKYIESVQPYHGRDWPDSFLSLLHELSNA